MSDFYEFFAGGGMARAGLGAGWSCAFANDFDAAKAAAYAANWGAEALRVGDVAALSTADLPGRPDLAWASFPCQDLSLAGARAGLDGGRSGAFRPFWGLMRGLVAEGRAPRAIVLENVCGLLSADGGGAYAALCAAIAAEGYRVGGLVVDAALFRPQSRPRLFVVAARGPLPRALIAAAPAAPFHPPALQRAAASAPGHVWWRLTAPAEPAPPLAALVEETPEGVRWHSAAETARLVSLMAPPSRARLAAALAAGGRHVGCVYRRTRPDGAGGRVQRAELRMDGRAGCLRTPAGGSSRQTLMIVQDGRVRSRLLSPRELARLMGLPEAYALPARYSAAYHLLGDGVVVDVVRWLAAELLTPLLATDAALDAA